MDLLVSIAGKALLIRNTVDLFRKKVKTSDLIDNPVLQRATGGDGCGAEVVCVCVSVCTITYTMVSVAPFHIHNAIEVCLLLVLSKQSVTSS